VSAFDRSTGISPKKEGIPATFTEVAGMTILELAKRNSKIVGITAAMPDGTGLDYLQKEIPERFFDVGIAEQHAVTFAAGLATQGYIPFVAIYSTFLQRAFDQIIHDVATQNLHVIFAIDRGGIVGADGPTHHGVFDLAFLRVIPKMVVMAPKDEVELRNMFYTATQYSNGPVAIRYPRGSGSGLQATPDFEEIEIGKAEILRKGSSVAILAIGNMVSHSLKAAELLTQSAMEAEVVNMRFVKPLDTLLLDEISKRFNFVVTVEDGVINGGFGSAVGEYFSSKNYSSIKMLNLGISDNFVTHGTPQELFKMLKLDSQGIAESIKTFLEHK
jgi:1-deoxy-D-xylulose-5-phosphate synthase